ncbi:MAG: hypothetical protein K2H38_01020 [Muribaculaceae bacterium]|nr:hypothetical protein [Muribaculaceae bacterium]
MKKFLLSSLIAAAAAVPALAGVDNINYQAVIKDGNAVVADKSVALKFELLDKADKVVYSEIQYAKTNAAGYVSCQLGQDKDITELEWGDLKLSVSVDLGSGYQPVSNEAISSVPSAIYSLRSGDTDTLREEVDAFATMVENRFDQLQKQADGLDTDLENIQENLTLAFEAKDAEIAEINGQLENLNQVAAVIRENEAAIDQLNTDTDAFATMVEGRFDQLQKQVDGLDDDLENIKENLTNAFNVKDEEIAEINGQLENLNNVAAVVRANEEAIEEMQGDFKNLDENLTNGFNEMDAKLEEVNGQLENLNNVAAVVRANEAAIDQLNTNTEAFATMVEGRLDQLQKDLELMNPEEEIKSLKATIANLEEEIDNLKEGMLELMKMVQGENFEGPSPLK